MSTFFGNTATETLLRDTITQLTRERAEAVQAARDDVQCAWADSEHALLTAMVGLKVERDEAQAELLEAQAARDEVRAERDEARVTLELSRAERIHLLERVEQVNLDHLATLTRVRAILTGNKL